MKFDIYTERLRGFLQAAQSLAVAHDHSSLTSLHLALALMKDEEGMISHLVTQAGGNPQTILETLETRLSSFAKVQGGVAPQADQSFVKVCEAAEALAEKKGDKFVSVERVFQALLKDKTSVVARAFEDAGVTQANAEKAVEALRKGRSVDSATGDANYDVLKRYGRDLTAKAREGKMDPVIGRDDEIRRAMQVLSRRTKNNPVLIGEPGVGKTAIAEGLAQRIVNNDVPDSLQGKTLIGLDLSAMVAGAKYRGEFEERLTAVLDEIRSAQGQVLVFIDEIHTLVGAGKTEGAMDASNMLKPALARGELHCLGATTLDEYRKYIEKDPALARRFQPVFIDEPSLSESISIMRGLKGKYEAHHGVRIQDNALVAAVTLSNRYISDRFLPDKAIDLMDEAAARLRMEVDSKPEEIDELDRRIIQLKIEREALKKEEDEASQKRLVALEEELLALEKDSADRTALWQAEREKVHATKRLKEELERARLDLEIAERDGKLEKASELMYGKIPDLEKKLKAAQSLLEGEESVKAFDVVTEEDIALIVARWTGIPVEKLQEGERQKLLTMEKELQRSVVGQEAAVKAVSAAVRRSRAGLQDPDRPLGSFLFLGPTGVGKTELAKSLAQFLFDDPHAMFRIDMSEYMEKHSVSRLIGSPPGYVGYEEGGILTESVRRRPYQVLLFDEVEKAHGDVFNLLLQVLDEGRLSDSHGRTVDFRNTIIVLTSNLGSEFLLDEETSTEQAYDQVMAVVQASFRPEFLNRLDELLLFNKLGRESMGAILEIQMKKLHKRLEAKGLKISLTSEAKEWLVERGYDPAYGARPLKRALQKDLQDPLSILLLEGQHDTDQVVHVDLDKDKGVLRFS